MASRAARPRHSLFSRTGVSLACVLLLGSSACSGDEDKANPKVGPTQGNLETCVKMVEQYRDCHAEALAAGKTEAPIEPVEAAVAQAKADLAACKDRLSELRKSGLDICNPS